MNDSKNVMWLTDWDKECKSSCPPRWWRQWEWWVWTRSPGFWRWDLAPLGGRPLTGHTERIRVHKLLKSRAPAGVSVYLKHLGLRHLQDLSDTLCCTDRDSCWKCIRRWSWDRLLRNPSPPDLPSGGSVAPGPENERYKICYLIPSKIYKNYRECQQASFSQTHKKAQMTPQIHLTLKCQVQRCWSFSLDRLIPRIRLRLHSRKYQNVVSHYLKCNVVLEKKKRPLPSFWRT